MDRKVIYLEDAIDALERKKDKKAKGDIGGFYNKIIQNDIDALMQLPSAQPEQRWIPCNERLPEEMTRVLTTIKMPSREPQVRSGIYSDGFFMNDNGDVWHTADKEVKAWQPLPEPYAER